MIPVPLLLMPPDTEAVRPIASPVNRPADIVPLFVIPPTMVPWLMKTGPRLGADKVPLLITLPATLTELEATETWVNVPVIRMFGGGDDVI